LRGQPFFIILFTFATKSQTITKFIFLEMKKIPFILLLFIPVFLNAQASDSKLFHFFIQKEYAKVFEAIEETNTFNATDFYYAGLSAEALEDTELATFYYHKSIATDSTFTSAQISLAQILFQNERYTDAIDIYAKLLETDTLNVLLWNGLGDCYAKLNLLPFAHSCYQNIFYLNPKNSSNTLKLISTLIALHPKEHLTEALFYCDSSLTYHPTHKPLLRRKVSLLFSKNEYILADAILENLMIWGDSSFMVLKHAGICRAVFYDYENAIFLLRKAHQLVSKDMEVMLHLASSLSRNSKYFDETMDLIDKINKQNEPDPAITHQVNTILAQSYLGVKDTLNAILQYYSTIKPNNIEDRLLRITNLANNVKIENSQTLLWYVHYYFLLNFKPEHEHNRSMVRQKSFSQSLLENYIKYMHQSGQKKVNWKTFEKKLKTVTMEELMKVVKL